MYYSKSFGNTSTHDAYAPCATYCAPKAGNTVMLHSTVALTVLFSVIISIAVIFSAAFTVRLSIIIAAILSAANIALIHICRLILKIQQQYA